MRPFKYNCAIIFESRPLLSGLLVGFGTIMRVASIAFLSFIIVCVYDALGFFFYMMNELSHCVVTPIINFCSMCHIVSNH